MSNRFQGGMSDEQTKVFIAESLEELPPDVLRLVYRITFFNMSGLD